MHTLLHSVPLTLQQATADPCLHQRLLDTHGQVWVSLLWGHFCLIDYAKGFDCVDHNKLWNSLKDWEYQAILLAS